LISTSIYIAYWLKRPIRWDPVREEIVGDEELHFLKKSEAAMLALLPG
jgi:hypothetical protein